MRGDLIDNNPFLLQYSHHFRYDSVNDVYKIDLENTVDPLPIWVQLYESFRFFIRKLFSEYDVEVKVDFLFKVKYHIQLAHNLILAVQTLVEKNTLEKSVTTRMFDDVLQMLYLIFGHYLEIIDEACESDNQALFAAELIQRLLANVTVDKSGKYIPPSLQRKQDEETRKREILRFRNNQYKDCFMLLSKLTTLDPVKAIPSFSMFLNDSFKVEKALKDEVKNIMTSTKLYVVTEQNFPIISFQSRLYSEIVSNKLPEQRIFAIDTLQNLLCHSNLYKYLSAGTNGRNNLSNLGRQSMKYVIKTFHFMVFSLWHCDSVGLESIEKILQLFSKLVFVVDSGNHASNSTRLLAEPVVEAQVECWNVIVSISRYNSNEKHDSLWNKRSIVVLRWLQVALKEMCIKCKQAKEIIFQTVCYQSSDYLSYLFQISSKFNLKSTKHYSIDTIKLLIDIISMMSPCNDVNFVQQIKHILFVSFQSQNEVERELACIIVAYGLSDVQEANSLELDQLVTMMERLVQDDKHLVRLKCLESMARTAHRLFGVTWNGNQLLHHLFGLLVSRGIVDEIGTVREAAFRTIGELLETLLLQKQQHTFRYFQWETFLCGLKDKKLAVRVQAAWSLSKYLLLIEHWQDSCDLLNDHEELFKVVEILGVLLDDSEKLLTTTIICIGLAAKVLKNIFLREYSIEISHPHQVVNRVHSLYNKLQLKIFGEELIKWSSTSFLKQSIEDNIVSIENLSAKFAQKVICGHCQSAQDLLTLLMVMSKNAQEDSELRLRVFEALQWMMTYLRFGFLQLQMVSAHAIINLLSTATSLFQPFKLSNELAQGILERVFLVVDQHIEQFLHVQRLRCKTLPNFNTHHTTTKSELVISRQRCLSSLLLKLIHYLTSSLTNEKDSETTRHLLESFNYHTESITSFLELHTTLATGKSHNDNNLNSMEKESSSIAKVVARTFFEAIFQQQGQHENNRTYISSIAEFRLHNICSTGLEEGYSANTFYSLPTGNYGLFDGLHNSHAYLNNLSTSSLVNNIGKSTTTVIEELEVDEI